MARFTFYHNRDGSGYLLDCQADVLRHFDTRLVVPLISVDQAPVPGGRLNPLFVIDGTMHSMVTQFAASVPVQMLGKAAGSLEEHEFKITGALDMLLTGV